MTSIMHSLKENYKDWQHGDNPVVDSYFLMDGPGEVLAIVAAYLIFVLKLGPSIMKNRPAMELRKGMIIYNGAQVLLSVFLIYKCALIEFPLNKLFASACQISSNKVSREKIVLYTAGWWYFLAKITELLDTVFFVLRKKNNQISFLHVYHHTIMAFFSWCYVKYAPNEIGGVVGMINSGVHVVMYTYYMIAAMGPKYQKYIWWKKYMTIMQLVQFLVIIGFLFLILFSKCGFSRTVTYFFITNAFIFLYLFADFYRKSYKKAPKTPKLENGFNSLENHKIEENGINHFNKENGVYSQISKDAALLNHEYTLRKRE